MLALTPRVTQKYFSNVYNLQRFFDFWGFAPSPPPWAMPGPRWDRDFCPPDTLQN